jgi:hypothetical protein
VNTANNRALRIREDREAAGLLDVARRHQHVSAKLCLALAVLASQSATWKYGIQ